MSVEKVRTALEVAVFAMTPTLLTSWENQDFTPPAQTTAGIPWQEVRFIFNEPDNSALGPSYYQERGVMQIVLHYPAGKGAHAAAARAELIRTTFARGESFSNGGVTTLIEKTPRIGQGILDAVHREWVLPVLIRFKADIFL